MTIRYVLCHFIILCVLITFLFSIMYYVVSDATYPSKFCNPDLCPVNVRHVACHPPGFALICIKPRLTRISTKMKRMILKKHNSLRNQVALGKLNNGLKSASRMGTVTWNNNLAYFAQVNSKECAIRYDECRNTKEYREVGQNIAEQAVNHKKINSDVIDQVILKIIEIWFSEFTAATQGLMDKYEIDEGGPKIEQFSNIIHERTVKIGCGMTSYYSISKKLTLLFVCNYSFRPYPELPIYTSGDPCSKCATKCSLEYPGLCHEGENIHSDPY